LVVVFGDEFEDGELDVEDSELMGRGEAFFLF